MIRFCDYCLKDVECTYHEKNVKIEVDNHLVSYLRKYYVCKECGEEFMDDLYNYDIETVNNELRKQSGIITIAEIEDILTKYNIGKKPLSLVLGLGEVNIIRYLDGANPTREISDLLKMISDNPFLYELYLQGAKDRITEIAFKKSLGKTKQLEFLYDHSKVYQSSLYVISKLNETDHLSLQKILYFADGFADLLFDQKLFEDVPKAWKYGPVYDEIYDCFSYYEWSKINYSELLKNREFYLSDDEKKFLDVIIRNFGCYSGSILREMSHLTDPWIRAREGLDKDESSTRIIEKSDMREYFEKVGQEYHIECAEDISRYANDLFEKAKDNLFNSNK